ncbi:hypothetical protein [Sporosarcina sp. G11-34]|uniref:hypothetical protein n=1 Tax=Sporosarcina sp. G11-34 TaxID=2849605 RepID=UPI0022A97B6E|nr:hypothetical protein [Sporosarcina sp. G11-34]MCZ2259160.1 hypothetical protein [Sporosarcina sp. G11-34]
MTTYLTDHAYFNNKNDMDEAVKQHVSAHSDNLNATDRAVLDTIRQYSITCGAAHLKHGTIESTVKKSNATVRRVIRKLERLDIIERIHYIRPVMSGLGANIYVVKPFTK